MQRLRFTEVITSNPEICDSISQWLGISCDSIRAMDKRFEFHDTYIPLGPFEDEVVKDSVLGKQVLEFNFKSKDKSFSSRIKSEFDSLIIKRSLKIMTKSDSIHTIIHCADKVARDEHLIGQFLPSDTIISYSNQLCGLCVMQIYPTNNLATGERVKSLRLINMFVVYDLVNTQHKIRNVRVFRLKR